MSVKAPLTSATRPPAPPGRTPTAVLSLLETDSKGWDSPTCPEESLCSVPGHRLVPYATAIHMRVSLLTLLKINECKVIIQVIVTT